MNQDLERILFSAEEIERAVDSVASVVMDRLLGLLSMLLMGLMSLTVFYRVYPHPALVGVVVVLTVAVVAALALGLSRTMHARVLARLPDEVLAAAKARLEPNFANGCREE